MRSSSVRNRKSKSRGNRLPIEPLERRQLLSTVVVNTTADSTDAKGSSTVSLRDAIAIANAATSATTITFSPTVFATAKTITLTGADLTLSNTSEATTITGPTATLTIDGQNKQNNGTDFQINGGVTVSISHLVVYRGAFTTEGNLTINQVTVSDEVFGDGYGAGIANISPATLVASDSTIIGNVIESGNGGGLWNSGKATLTDVTISGNTASNQGAGVYNSGTLSITRGTISANNIVGGGDHGGGIYNAGIATLTDVTITGSKAGGGIDNQNGNAVLKDCTVSGNTALENGGGICSFGGSVSLANTIVAGNTADETGPDVYGPFKSLGHNLIGKTDASTGWISTDSTGTIAKPLNADLGSLADNGGPTETLLPLTGSPAIDKGSNSLVPTGTTTDQRGLPRIYNGTVDIGAVEVEPVIQITAPGSQTATVNVSKSVTLGSFAQYTNDAPFKDVITWGDGSASTTLSLTAAGTIPATAHVFAKSGTITVTETITDSKGNKSNTVAFTETVTGAVGSIAGVVFADANDNGKQDKGEVGLGLFTVYLDINNNGKLDTGDKSTTTDIHGNFSFTSLAAGTYYLRIVPDTVDTTTTPTLIKVLLSAGQISTGNVFGEN